MGSKSWKYLMQTNSIFSEWPICGSGIRLFGLSEIIFELWSPQTSAIQKGEKGSGRNIQRWETGKAENWFRLDEWTSSPRPWLWTRGDACTKLSFLSAHCHGNDSSSGPCEVWKAVQDAGLPQLSNACHPGLVSLWVGDPEGHEI